MHPILSITKNIFTNILKLQYIRNIDFLKVLIGEKGIIFLIIVLFKKVFYLPFKNG